MNKKITRPDFIKKCNLTDEMFKNYQLDMEENQIQNLLDFHDGEVLINNSRHKKDVLVFKLFGRQYSTNENRSKQYCLDDNWKVYKCEKRFLTKMYLVAFGGAHKLNYSKKAILAGV